MDLSEQIRYIDNLPSDIQNSIKDYTLEGFEQLNSNLRKYKRLSKQQKTLADNLDIAFKNVPKITEPLITWRGIKEDYIPNIGRSYVSTSLDIKQTEEFRRKSCCLIRISIPSGTNVLPIMGISHEIYESEILLPRTGTFILTNQSVVSEHTELFHNTTLSDDLKVYDIIFVPEQSIIIEAQPIKQIQKQLTQNATIDAVMRTVSDIDKEELEMYDNPNAIIEFVIPPNYKLSTAVYNEAILRLKKMYF